MPRLFSGTTINGILELEFEYPGTTPLLKVVRESCKESEGEVDPGILRHIKLLLRAGADASIPDENKATPLHYAAFYGKLKVVESLLKTPGGVPVEDALESKGKIVPRPGWCGNVGDADTGVLGHEGTPRDLALEKGHSEIVEYIDGKGWMEDDEESKAAAAAEKEEDEMWTWALSKWGITGIEDINELGQEGTTALIDAVMGGNLEDVKKLLEAGADPSVPSCLETGADSGDEEPSEFRMLPLHYAAGSGNVEITKLLLQTPGTPGIVGENDMVQSTGTALHMAAREGHAKVVELLLKSPGGPDALEIKSFDQTPRDIALEEGHSEIVEYIDSKGWMKD